MTIKINAVVDRISDGTKAILIAEQIKKEFIVDTNLISSPLKEGMWVDLYLDQNNQIKRIIPNEKLTQQKRHEISQIMNRLRKRKGSKFKP